MSKHKEYLKKRFPEWADKIENIPVNDFPGLETDETWDLPTNGFANSGEYFDSVTDDKTVIMESFLFFATEDEDFWIEAIYHE